MSALQARLEAGAREFGVPGAQLAVLTRDGSLVEVAVGVCSTRTGVDVTPTTVFQIGSITKVWTATLALQLVDDGLLDLDEPVVSYLPGFRVADAAVTSRVTARHLLAHTSGIDGDLFVDTGSGDDCLGRYVALMHGLTQVHPLGDGMSYCNAGYSLLGHLVATLRGRTWEQVLREQLLEPLGLTRAGTSPDEAVLERAAVGHGRDGAPLDRWGIARSSGPAGIVHATAREQVEFARLHLSGGRAAGGQQVLSAAAVQAMQQVEARIPEGWSIGTHYGLGWALSAWNGVQVFGHDGDTGGQRSFLRVVPSTGAVVVLSTNGGSGRDLFEQLLAELGPELLGARPPALPAPSGGPLPEDAVSWQGRYRRESQGFDIRYDGRLTLTAYGADPTVALADVTLHHVEGSTYVGAFPGLRVQVPLTFLRNGNLVALHVGGRTTPRVGD